MTQRQLAEKCDEPGCLNISPFYDWLPLLLHLYSASSQGPQMRTPAAAEVAAVDVAAGRRTERTMSATCRLLYENGYQINVYLNFYKQNLVLG